MAVQLDSVTDRELLNLRLCDLPVSIHAARLQEKIRRLYRELASHTIAFRPHVWLSEEWFTPDGVAGFAIPFYLAHPRLMRLERTQMLEVEGGSDHECMRIMRHEAGHAISNAFKLHTRRSWTRTFGSFHAAYPQWYKPRAESRDYVLNLEAWYAQAHPAEDFAETFAVWLKPGMHWRGEYKAWGAIEKLHFVDTVMAEIAGKPATVNSRREVEALPRLKKTLAEHYQKKREYYTIDWPKSFERNLYLVFSEGPARYPASKAAHFLRRNRRLIGDMVSRGTGVHPYTVNHILRHMIVRARELKLRLLHSEAETFQLSIVCLTMQVMQVVRGGYHRIPL